MRLVAVCGLLLVAGCGTPSPEFRGIAALRVTVQGSTFDIRRRGDLVEAIRINSEYAPRLGPIEGRARRAIRVTTGCAVRWIAGDQAVLLGRLTCAD